MLQTLNANPDGVTFAQWWQGMRAARTIPQWRNKFVNEFNADRAFVDNLTIQTAGGALFRHLTTDGNWQAAPLQDAPAGF